MCIYASRRSMKIILSQASELVRYIVLTDAMRPCYDALCLRIAQPTLGEGDMKTLQNIILFLIIVFPFAGQAEVIDGPFTTRKDDIELTIPSKAKSCTLITQQTNIQDALKVKSTLYCKGLVVVDTEWSNPLNIAQSLYPDVPGALVEHLTEKGFKGTCTDSFIPWDFMGSEAILLTRCLFQK